jgi:hypothetical protein
MMKCAVGIWSLALLAGVCTSYAPLQEPGTPAYQETTGPEPGPKTLDEQPQAGSSESTSAETESAEADQEKPTPTEASSARLKPLDIDSVDHPKAQYLTIEFELPGSDFPELTDYASANFAQRGEQVSDDRVKVQTATIPGLPDTDEPIPSGEMPDKLQPYLEPTPKVQR